MACIGLFVIVHVITAKYKTECTNYLTLFYKKKFSTFFSNINCNEFLKFSCICYKFTKAKNYSRSFRIINHSLFYKSINVYKTLSTFFYLIVLHGVTTIKSINMITEVSCKLVSFFKSLLRTQLQKLKCQ